MHAAGGVNDARGTFDKSRRFMLTLSIRRPCHAVVNAASNYRLANHSRTIIVVPKRCSALFIQRLIGMKEVNSASLSLEDQSLVNAATSLIIRRAKYGRHHIACALRTTTKQQFSGLHISANIGTGSICAEAAAIAESLKEDSVIIERIVTIRYKFDVGNNIEIVPPCGSCREHIFEYGPNASVILTIESESTLISIAQLLYMPFQRARKNRIESIERTIYNDNTPSE